MLHDCICSTYNSLLESGWHMKDIDDMDFLGFLKIRAWKANKDSDDKKPRKAYIDEVWPDLK